MRPPTATYRLQLHSGFTLDAARELLPYLDRLGVSHLYLSPVLQARSGSTHGYDVTDPTRVREELGGDKALARLADDAHARGMGIMLDVVPNHMAASVENPWWYDVLRYGPASRYAASFDIDWEPARPGLAGKVLLPILATPYGAALEAGELAVALGEDGLAVTYRGGRLPLSPRSQATLLGHGLSRLGRTAGPASPAVLELAAIVDALAVARPHDEEGVRAATARLARLAGQDPTVRAHVEANLRRWNGRAGHPRSFDLLDRLLDTQSYRLAYWPVADHEINYRRFFDISDLVAVRVEDERVFNERLTTILRLVRSGIVDGLRIDHVDGLHDPAAFLRRLREAVGARTYTVVEKILAPGEELEPWPVQGTTGYEVLNALNDLFIDPAGLARPDGLRAGTGPDDRTFADDVYAAKRLVITDLFGGELRNLAQRLGRLAEQHRQGRDLTLTELGRALVGVTACLPVYRTYVDAPHVSAHDGDAIARAIAEATRRDPDAARAVAFLRHVFLLDVPARRGPVQRALWLRFVMRWQQLASAAMAKGHEDTACYRNVRLLSRNEVGGHPDAPLGTVAGFHQRMAARLALWPHALSTAATHDTKRGADVRARIDALSELPDETARRYASWRSWCEARVGPSARAVDADTAFLLFQTIVGAWPLAPDPAFGERIAVYAVKAAREARRETSWRDPREPYESVLVAYARAVIDAPDEEPTKRELAAFAERVALIGARTSLAQTLLALTLPGVPDLYQGGELWDLSLVDPDNRRPVDFARRRDLLAQLDARRDRRELARELMARWPDGQAKLYLIATTLRKRREERRLFEEGRYIPLATAGERSSHVVAFARAHEERWIATVVPRLVARRDDWADTTVVLPPGAPARWDDALTSNTHAATKGELRVAELLAAFPVALLVGRFSTPVPSGREASQAGVAVREAHGADGAPVGVGHRQHRDTRMGHVVPES